MKRFLIIFFTLFSINQAFCQKKFVQPLLKVAEVTFPDTPKTDDTILNQRWVTFYARTPGINYLASFRKLHSNAQDFFTKDLRDSVYNSIIRYRLDSGTRLFCKKNINAYGMRAFYFAYSKRDSVTTYHYYRCFYFNHSLLYTAVITLDSLDVNDKKITSFFNTLKFKVSASEMQQDNFSDIVFTWQAVLIGILIFLSIILLLYFISKLANKNR